MNNTRTIVFLTLSFFLHKPELSSEKNHEILESKSQLHRITFLH